MRLAVPCEGNRIADNFGHAPQFVFFDADLGTGQIEKEETLAAPPIQPGVLPEWLAAQKADVMLTAGLGGCAQGLFTQHGVDVITGIVLREPRKAVEEYLGGMLAAAHTGPRH